MSKLEIKSILKQQKGKLADDVVGRFGSLLSTYITDINNALTENQSEEHLKNVFNDFLRDSFYNRDDGYSINVDGRTDSSIKKENELLVLIETKKPSNKNEMVAETEFNRKALWELTLYYLKSRYEMLNRKAIKIRGVEIRQLAITDSKKIFIIDAREFDKICDGKIAKIYEKWSNGGYSSSANDEFYGIVKNHFSEIDITAQLGFIVLDLEKANSDPKHLQEVFRLLSSSFLLREQERKVQTNVLNDKFYSELLYVMGLKEEKISSKKVIRIDHSIKNSITNQLYIKFHNNKDYSEDKSSELALELAILWINRLLFIKLFEGQLISINGEANENLILSADKIEDFDNVNDLFFNVLGVQIPKREKDDFYNKFAYIPYLNSSLFERYDTEKEQYNISILKNSEITMFPRTVLNKNKTTMPLLHYIIDFLNSYNFGGVVSDNDTIVQGKDIINAAVLGLIFEKINGYKDGAHFTPSAITEYMSKETIERAIISKINETFKKKYTSLEEVADFAADSLDNRKSVNAAINTLKVCDPAVGSGHFLVSVLNRIIEIKHRLRVLFLPDGTRCTDINIDIEDDVLIVTDGQGNPFKYAKSKADSQNIQKMLFNEKRTLIEECLFGVDINSKAVAICQLRLWIELLKNAYYENGVMETLPNIDINIKCGNSLISKLSVEIGTKPQGDSVSKEDEKVFAKILTDYKRAVKVYKSENNKYAKQETKKQIDNLKFLLRKQYVQITLLEDESPTETTINIYENAFEWSIEFPEVLGENGVFLGFDVVIGNPPYISTPDMVKYNPNERESIKNSNRFLTLHQKWDIYIPFMEFGMQILKKNGKFAMIVPYPLTNQIYAQKMRELILSKYNLVEITDLNGTKIFESATVSNCIPFIIKESAGISCKISNINEDKQISISFVQPYSDLVQDKKSLVWNLTQVKRESNRHSNLNILGDFCYVSKGMVLNADEKTAKGEFKKIDLINSIKDNIHCKKYIEGKDIDKYVIARIRYLEYNTERCPDKVSRPTFRELYECQKLLINKLGAIKVAFDNEGTFTHDQTLRCAILWTDLCGVENNSIAQSIKRYSNHSREKLEELSKQVDLRYLLGILNSKYAMVLLANLRGGDFNISPEHMKKLPIPLLDYNQQQSIIKLVDKILIAKQSDPAADTSALESEIDRLVYELYGLMEKEVKVVEGTTKNQEGGIYNGL